MSLYLVMLTDGSEGSGERLEIGDELVFGRDAGAPGSMTFVLAQPEVSRRHARVVNGPGGLELEDLDSRNGTRVNGQLVGERRVLVAGDRIEIGDAVLEVHADLAETRISAPSTETAPPVQETVIGQARATPPARIAREPVSEPVSERPPAVPPAPRAPEGPFARPAARGGSSIASRRQEPAIATFAVILATAIALVVYFAMH